MICVEDGLLTHQCFGCNSSKENMCLHAITHCLPPTFPPPPALPACHLPASSPTPFPQIPDRAGLRACPCTPGRRAGAQVCMHIPLPDTSGREQILAIHLRKAREAGLVSPDVDDAALAGRTGGFSGADLAGLVRSATSFALADWRRKRQAGGVGVGGVGENGADEGGTFEVGAGGGGEGGGAAPGEGGYSGLGEDDGVAVEITAAHMEQALREVGASYGGGRGGRGRFGGLGAVGGALRGGLRKVLETPRGGGIARE